MEGSKRTRLLRVDLTAGTVEHERVPEPWLRAYIGGKGVGARYLYEELAAGVDPLGPDNALLFMLGPLTGYLPGESRYAAITKSPLTGSFLDSYSGGQFPATLAGALAGHLGVLVTGAPVSDRRANTASSTLLSPPTPATTTPAAVARARLWAQNSSNQLSSAVTRPKPSTNWRDSASDTNVHTNRPMPVAGRRRVKPSKPSTSPTRSGFFRRVAGRRASSRVPRISVSTPPARPRSLERTTHRDSASRPRTATPFLAAPHR